MHFNCIISFCNREHWQESHPPQQPVVAGLLLCTDRWNSPPWRKIWEIRPRVTAFATFSHLTLSGGNICVLHVIHHQCIWQTGLARKRSNTWAAFLNLSALGKKWNLNGEKGFQQATPAGMDERGPILALQQLTDFPLLHQWGHQLWHRYAESRPRCGSCTLPGYSSPCHRPTRSGHTWGGRRRKRMNWVNYW